ncbi:MAG TPA: hypothetical protein VF316_14690 [Polyangiaceae bacterium]
MQRDLMPREIDWVFCWRTSTGDVRPGARNAGALKYHPQAVGSEHGLRTIVRGRAHTRAAKGPRLDQLGALSRGGCFVEGYVTHGALVPARTERELRVLWDAARAAVLAGEATEWSLAAIGARNKVHWALRIGQNAQDSPSPKLVAELAARVMARWTLRIEENGIVYVDREGHEVQSLEADTLFDAQALPAFALLRGKHPRFLEPENLPEEGTAEFEATADEWAQVMMEWVRCAGVEVTDDDGPRARVSSRS